MIRFGSVCSGIEAASVAWHTLGWRAAWLAEIEPFPSAVLAHHYPDVPNLGDMTTLPERILSGEVEAPDLFCGGTPCQAFSVAGLRRSLDDARGNLSLTFCEIADAIDAVRLGRGERPGIIFWENVPGCLATKDNFFGCFLAGLAGEDAPLEPPRDKWTDAGCVLGPQRTVAWRTLDAQYFGVAQRRRRVFVVASSRDDIDPAKILFEFSGLRRDLAPLRKTREVSPTIPSRSTAGGGLGADFDCDGGLQPVAARMVAFGEYVDDGTASAMKAREYKDATDLVAQPVVYERHDQDGRVREITVAPTQHAKQDNGCDLPIVMQPVAFHNRQDPDVSGNITHPLGAKDNGMGVMQPVAMTFDWQAGGGGTDTSFRGKSRSYVTDQPGRTRALTSCKTLAVQTAMQVRRLTPVECERLQGFPDGYTNIPWRGKPESPDGPRYKALGNSWAVPVVRWIGERIASHL